MSKMHFFMTPIPVAADTSLSGTDHRVLCVIAFHDRNDANGRGCFATTSTLAQMAKCSIRSAERSIAKLVENNHVRRERAAGDGRRLVLRVNYPAFTAKTVGDFLRNARQVEQRYPTNLNEVSEGNQSLAGGNERSNQIPSNGEAYAAEAAPFLRNSAHHREISPEEWIARLSEGAPFGHYLRTIYETMRGMSPGTRGDHVHILYGMLDKVLSHGETDYHWAERLMTDMEMLNEAEGYDSAGFRR